MSPERAQHQINWEEIIFLAQETILRCGRHVPTLIVEGSQKMARGQIQDLPETHGERLELMRFLGQSAAKDGNIDKLHEVFMIFEGWLSAEGEDKPAEARPAQDPKRKEVLIISGLQMKERKKLLKIFEILREKDHKIVGFEECLSDEKQQEATVEVPLLEAFVHGFQSAFLIKNN